MGLPSRMAYSQSRTLAKIAEGFNSILLFKESDTKNYQRKISRLVRRGYIELSGENIRLTPSGKLALKSQKIYNFEIEIPEKWDGVWHIVAYDIPEELKYTRNHFRRRLKAIGFSYMQGSMWLFPFDCKEAIGLLAQHLKVEKYVMYLNTDRIPGQAKFIHKYKLR